MLKEIEQTLTLNGTGDTLEKALQRVFLEIKPAVARAYAGNMVVEIRLKDTRTVSATETVYTERFLGLLFPRQKSRYHVTLAITVQLRMIAMAEITVEQEVEKLSLLQRCLKAT
ncbi:MAG: DUF4312 family protein [Sporomusaceae bacterium]|nr:DUF4312 family protein [Sporomusaceae bacterium]